MVGFGQMGPGKGWARGLTAETDPRVARAAASHRGLTRVWRKAWSEMRWTFASRTVLALEWSDPMGYVVGLTATDGCLGSRATSINFKSADRELVETYTRLLGRTNPIREQLGRTGNTAYYVTFKDARFYRWLIAVGVTPRKSLTLGAINVPDEFLCSLVRGLLDGDGSISNSVSKADTSRRDDYYYEWLRTRFSSASRTHLEWLKARLQMRLGLKGWISMETRDEGRMAGSLCYAKHDSIKLLSWLYLDRTAPCLERKRAIWASYAERHGLSPYTLESRQA